MYNAIFLFAVYLWELHSNRKIPAHKEKNVLVFTKIILEVQADPTYVETFSKTSLELNPKSCKKTFLFTFLI